MTFIPCPSCQAESCANVGATFDISGSNSSDQMLVDDARRNLPVQLAICGKCGLLFNRTFDKSLMNYENTFLSSFFNHQGMKESYYNSIEQIIECVPKLSESFRVFEFGCGDREFLDLIVEEIEKKYNFFPPSLGYDLHVENETDTLTSDIGLVEKFLSGEDVLILCRHTLEHLDETEVLWNMVNQCNAAVIYLEVPNGEAALLNGSFEDVVYDHVSYFSLESLARHALCHDAKVLNAFYLLGRENIGLICQKQDRNITDECEFYWKQELLEGKGEAFRSDIDRLAGFLSSTETVFWGVGGRCLSVLSCVQRSSADDFPCLLVDSDEKKWGKKIPGFSQKVQAPKQLLNSSANLIIIGTRVGRPYILDELNSLSVLNKECDVVFWRDV